MLILQMLRWPLQLPQNIVLVVFTVMAYILLAMLRHSSEVLFELMLLVLTPVFYGIFGMLALNGQLRLNDVARGRFTEPEYERTALNPFQSLMAAKLALLFVAGGALFLLPEPQLWLSVAAVVYPGLFLALVLEGSFRSMFNPALLWKLVKGLNLLYPVVAVMVSGSAGWLAYVLLFDQRFLSIAMSAGLFLLVHPLVGLLVFTCRGMLDLHTLDSPEQRRAAQALEEARTFDRLLEELQRLCGSGNVQQASTRLDVYLADKSFADDAQVHERLRSFQDSRLFLEHGFRYLRRLLERGENKKAWTLFKDCHAIDDRFRPSELASLLILTSTAEKADARLVESLLGDAKATYPGSEDIPEALFRQARINIELLKDGTRGLEILSQVIAGYPEFAASEAFRRYRARLRVNRKQ
jgi:hypothetical protein